MYIVPREVYIFALGEVNTAFFGTPLLARAATNNSHLSIDKAQIVRGLHTKN
jgi:hypothetical protein